MSATEQETTEEFAATTSPFGSTSGHARACVGGPCDRMSVRPLADDGRELNAEFSVEADGAGLSLVLESAGGQSMAGGSSRNHEYVAGLTLLLRRLADRSAVLSTAVLASRRVSDLPESHRTLLAGPVELAGVADFELLRLGITRAEGAIGQRDGVVKEGNNRKRIRLRLIVPGYGLQDASRLAVDLATPATGSHRPVAVSAEGFVGAELLSAVERLARHRQTSLHKPLALLWTIGRLACGEDRLAPWPLFREGVGQLLTEWATGPHSRVTPEYPFWHLRTSVGLWEVHGVSGPPTKADTTACAGFTVAAAELVRDPTFRMRVVDLLVDRHLSGVAHVERLLDQVGLAVQHAVLPSACEVLESLIGREIRTAIGRLNTVLTVDAANVVVATVDSPQGGVVPVQEVQQGLDLLARHREVRIHPDALGYRSSFVGAVLATLPGARFIEKPTRVVLDQAWVAGDAESAGAGISASPTRPGRRAGAAGYVQDAVVRRALEIHAVDWAMRHYQAQGFDVRDVGATCPYDVLAVRGTKELHIEVKGSSVSDVSAVELTRGEVDHGLTFPTDLVVIDGIRVERLPSGEIRTAGGHARVWQAWTPTPGSLTATRYRHSVPGDPDENCPAT